jgi:hypothetical protein
MKSATKKPLMVASSATATNAKTGALSALDPWANSSADGDMTVEQFLEKQCEAIMDEVRKNAATLISKLRAEYEAGAKEVRGHLQASISVPQEQPLCVLLKCTTGPHIGQKFRLELVAGKDEDSFKLGRSTGKVFKEKGVSLYKDKEVSTAHGKIEIRNGVAFFIDTKSTNGTIVNGKMIETQQPVRLSDGDVLSVGGTELAVTITRCIEEENFASV